MFTRRIESPNQQFRRPAAVMRLKEVTDIIFLPRNAEQFRRAGACDLLIAPDGRDLPQSPNGCEQFRHLAEIAREAKSAIINLLCFWRRVPRNASPFMREPNPSS